MAVSVHAAEYYYFNFQCKISLILFVELLEQLSESENKNLVRQALEKMKAGSSDPVFKRNDAVLDCFF